jgi:hypothetical protein
VCHQKAHLFAAAGLKFRDRFLRTLAVQQIKCSCEGLIIIFGKWLVVVLPRL